MCTGSNQFSVHSVNINAQRLNTTTSSGERRAEGTLSLGSSGSEPHSGHLSNCVFLCAWWDRRVAQLSVPWTAHVVILGATQLLLCVGLKNVWERATWFSQKGKTRDNANANKHTITWSDKHSVTTLYQRLSLNMWWSHVVIIAKTELLKQRRNRIIVYTGMQAAWGMKTDLISYECISSKYPSCAEQQSSHDELKLWEIIAKEKLFLFFPVQTFPRVINLWVS